MKTRPIIFNGETMRAILDRRKTQTRRVIRPQPEHIEGTMHRWRKWLPYLPQAAHLIAEHCPYGVPGDLLWVREGYRLRQVWDDNSPPKGAWVEGRKAQGLSVPRIQYRADETFNHNQNPFATMWKPGRWRPSIFMPRWASRITLRVLDVRVERVCEISHNDACVEGAPSDPELNNRGTGSIYRDWFAELWDSINAKRGYGWDVNPWVWVIGFGVEQ